MSCIAKSQQPSQMRHSQSQTHCITIFPPQKSESLHTWADYSRFQRCATHGLTPPPPRHRRSKIWEGHHSSPRGEPFRGISSPNSPGPIDPLHLCCASPAREIERLSSAAGQFLQLDVHGLTHGAFFPQGHPQKSSERPLPQLHPPPWRREGAP